MINAKLGLIIAAAVAVIIAAYFAIRPSQTPPPTPVVSAPVLSVPPSPQYFHDHLAELAEAKVKCNQGTAPAAPYCTNVRKAEELVEVDEYKKALGSTGAK